MPEETFHENLFAALVAANYHAAKTSMRYGGDWADRVKWMEGRQSPVFTKIPKLGHAKALLDRMGRPTPSARHTLLTHAHAAVDRARVLTHSRADGPVPIVPTVKGTNEENPDLTDIVRVLKELALKRADFTVNRVSYDPVTGLSEFGATLTHRRRPNIDTFKNWKFSVDPRNWTTVLPEMFARSDEIDTIVTDRFVDPRKAATSRKKEFHLFEDARLKVIGLPLTNFRNVLNVSFRVERKPNDNGTLTPTYSLRESLTNTLLDFATREGGIDVDSCESGDSEVKLEGGPKGRITVKAAKRIRFSAECPFAVELNLLALPFLEAWITELLIGGAAAGGSARQKAKRQKPRKPGKRESIRVAA